TFGKPTVAGVLENLAAAANHDRNLLGRQLESLEQCACVGIAIDVEVHVGPAVASQKFANAQRVACVTGTEHDHVAKLGVVLHYSAKTLETHLQHAARVSDAEPDEAGRSAQRAHLAAKIAGGK